MQNNQIKDVLDPTDDQDAATKLYVDNLVGTNSLNNLTISGNGLLFDNLTSQLSLTAIINDIVDVDITLPQINQTLVYNGTNWVNQDPVTQLANLTDVELTSLADNDVLQYDTVSSKWKNEQLPPTTSTIAGATDYDNTIPATDQQIIQFDGTLNKFKPVTFSGGVDELSELLDVQIQAPLTDEQNLVYEQSINKWVNKSSVNQQIALLSYFANSTSAWIVSKTFVSNIGGFAVNFNTPSTLRNSVSNRLGVDILIANDYTWRLIKPAKY